MSIGKGEKFVIQVNGGIIKKLRKEQKLTQSDLANNICKQATISNIERKNHCNNITILGKICARLNVKLTDILIEYSENNNSKILNEVENLCSLGKHSEALNVLENNIKDNNEERIETELLAQYYYLKGITLLIAENDIEKSIIYFHRSLNQETPDSIYKILAKSSMGIAFSLKKEYLLAEEYYNDSVKLIDSLLEKPVNLNKVFYNSAKLASDQMNFEKALELCNKGIDLNKLHHSTELLDFLLYEKSFNLYKINKLENSFDLYKNAMFMAKFNNNEYLQKIIKEDINNFFEGLSY